MFEPGMGIAGAGLDIKRDKCGMLEGVKHDTDKPRYDLIPPEALLALAHLYGIGAKKYDDRNWEKGLKWGRLFRAMMSHAWAWWGGEELDKDDGQHHLDSVIWGAMALRTYVARECGEDDRFTSSQILNTLLENAERVEDNRQKLLKQAAPLTNNGPYPGGQ